ncbi:MAG: LysM peptidoglycan-binding domain-containing protein [Chloroflexi bacterium]|nr:LysM peptidoglycan-binding domain-containing protein [Chloroflexota bacterium]
MSDKTITRRRFLKVIAGSVTATVLARGGILRPAWVRAFGQSEPSTPRQQGVRHLAWVWQFKSDGSPGHISEILSPHGLGIVVKTHDGTDWMATYDKSSQAVSGTKQVERLASYFEEAGVPFHAWCVIKGIDPKREAQMCGAVLASGARSMTIDLEPHAGFWKGTPQDALVFGDELRRLQPLAWISISLDPRPWIIKRVPVAEFASFSNELAPQLYWDTFNTGANLEKFALENQVPGPEGVTPRFLLEATIPRLAQFGLPMQPLGQGSTINTESWQEFVDQAYVNDMEAVSVWRFGVTKCDVWEALAANPPRPHKYIVQPGDNLTSLARSWNTTIAEIAELNEISDPNFIRIGQELLVPRGARVHLPI